MKLFSINRPFNIASDSKVPFRKDNSFSRCKPNFGICITFLEIRETNLEAVFCVFQQFSGSPRFRAYKNEHNLQPGALKVTKSEFLDEKCVSFVSLCGAMGEDLVEILISHGF